MLIKLEADVQAAMRQGTVKLAPPGFLPMLGFAADLATVVSDSTAGLLPVFRPRQRMQVRAALLHLGAPAELAGHEHQL